MTSSSSDFVWITSEAENPFGSVSSDSRFYCTTKATIEQSQICAQPLLKPRSTILKWRKVPLTLTNRRLVCAIIVHSGFRAVNLEVGSSNSWCQGRNLFWDFWYASALCPTQFQRVQSQRELSAGRCDGIVLFSFFKQLWSFLQDNHL